MSYTVVVEKEIEACFREDPSLINKSFKEMAVFFYIQGELRNSALRDALKAKVEHYRTALGKIDFEQLKEIDTQWKDND